MNINMILGAVALVAAVILAITGGWFGILLGIVAGLLGLLLLVRGFRQRSAAA